MTEKTKKTEKINKKKDEEVLILLGLTILGAAILLNSARAATQITVPIDLTVTD